MRDSLDKAVSVRAEKSLTAEAKIRLGIDQHTVSEAELIAIMLGRYRYKSEERKGELGIVAKKIEMYRTWSVVEYLTKHRAWLKDMINAWCEKIIRNDDEKITMRFILDGLKEDAEWAPFWSAYKMFKKIREPEDIDELEDWMLDHERE